MNLLPSRLEESNNNTCIVEILWDIGYCRVTFSGQFRSKFVSMCLHRINYPWMHDSHGQAPSSPKLLCPPTCEITLPSSVVPFAVHTMHMCTYWFSPIQKTSGIAKVQTGPTQTGEWTVMMAIQYTSQVSH